MTNYLAKQIYLDRSDLMWHDSYNNSWIDENAYHIVVLAAGPVINVVADDLFEPTDQASVQISGPLRSGLSDKVLR